MNYVVGDVHGCFDELQILLNKIEGRDPYQDTVESEYRLAILERLGLM